MEKYGLVSFRPAQRNSISGITKRIQSVGNEFGLFAKETRMSRTSSNIGESNRFLVNNR